MQELDPGPPVVVSRGGQRATVGEEPMLRCAALLADGYEIENLGDGGSLA